jgi:hypothetical protein
LLQGFFRALVGIVTQMLGEGYPSCRTNIFILKLTVNLQLFTLVGSFQQRLKIENRGTVEIAGL